LDHAAIGQRVEARIAEQAETEEDAQEEDAQPSSAESEPHEEAPVAASEAPDGTSEDKDVIELLD
jgi:hypothetical protein